MYFANTTNPKEAFLEPYFRLLRFNSGKNYYQNLNTIFDFGCGPNALFYNYLKQKKLMFSKYVGFDPLFNSKKETHDFKTVKSISKTRTKFDLITMFAVLEHLDYPSYNFSFLKQISHKDTTLLLTTPTIRAHKILEFLSYTLGLVSKREIDEHKHYYTSDELSLIFGKLGFEMQERQLFEFGFNLFMVFKRI